LSLKEPTVTTFIEYWGLGDGLVELLLLQATMDNVKVIRVIFLIVKILRSKKIQFLKFFSKIIVNVLPVKYGRFTEEVLSNKSLILRVMSFVFIAKSTEYKFGIN